jgi:glycosyltransferase involved in cell wall biosynthesis
MIPFSYFSVIVPVYNGAENIDTCLTALINQDYPKDKYEIVVVNDGSTDNTAEIVSRYPIRLINLNTNKGRIVARNVGAEAAKYETLVFNDVRVIPERQLLSKISKLKYQPLLPDVDDYDGSKCGFKRFFYLLRCKIYAPYYPLSATLKEIRITAENFDRTAKGTTNLICDKSLWLKCQPQVVSKSTSDDTLILRKMVEYRPILKTTAVSVKYHQRTSPRDVILHTFERGPRFADYYLHPGGRYYLTYLISWLLVSFVVLGLIIDPSVALISGAGFLLLVFAGVIMYFMQNLRDILVLATCLPVVAGAFGLGILKWQIAQIVKTLRSV